jgi:hypothetical protein
MKHYRCYRVWIWNTRSEHVADTLAWFPTRVVMPTLSSLELALAAAKDLVKALRHPTAGSPLAPSTDSQTAALKQLADIFQDCTKRSPLLQADAEDAAKENIAAANQEVQRGSAGDQGLPPGVPQGSPGGAVPRVQTEIQRDLAGAVPRVDPVNGPSQHPTTAPTPSPTTTPSPNTHSKGTAIQTTSATPPRVVPLAPTAPTTAAPATVPTYNNMAQGSTRRRRRPSTKKGKGKGTLVASSMQLTQALATVVRTPASDTEPTTTPNTEPTIPHGYAHAVIDPNTGKSQNYRQLMQGPDAAVWIQGCTNEMSQLLLGIDPTSNTGTDTIRFIGHDEVPTGKTPTYLSIVVGIQPKKEETHRVRFTCGGDKTVYAGNVSTPTADMSTIKIHLNSTISTKNAKYMTKQPLADP